MGAMASTDNRYDCRGTVIPCCSIVCRTDNLGAHKRCTKKGLLIKPEAALISLKGLKRMATQGLYGMPLRALKSSKDTAGGL